MLEQLMAAFAASQKTADKQATKYETMTAICSSLLAIVQTTQKELSDAAQVNKNLEEEITNREERIKELVHRNTELEKKNDGNGAGATT